MYMFINLFKYYIKPQPHIIIRIIMRLLSKAYSPSKSVIVRLSRRLKLKLIKNWFKEIWMRIQLGKLICSGFCRWSIMLVWNFWIRCFFNLIKIQMCTRFHGINLILNLRVIIGFHSQNNS